MIKNDIKNIHTMIGEDVVIDGPIVLNNGIIVYGKINGKIETNGSVRIAKNAIVNGDISGGDIRIGGEVIGNIISNGQVTLIKTCSLKGDITYQKLHIQDGAKFEGKCDILSENPNIK